MSQPPPIKERIEAALAEGPLTYDVLAWRVFPPHRFPRAWNYASHGGPPGCFMALSSAIRRYGFKTWWTSGRLMVGAPRPAGEHGK